MSNVRFREVRIRNRCGQACGGSRKPIGSELGCHSDLGLSSLPSESGRACSPGEVGLSIGQSAGPPVLRRTAQRPLAAEGSAARSGRAARPLAVSSPVGSGRQTARHSASAAPLFVISSFPGCSQAGAAAHSQIRGSFVHQTISSRSISHRGPFSVCCARQPNPSIERTCQRPLRALWSAAHVERWAPVCEAGCTRGTEVEAVAPVRSSSAGRFTSPLRVANCRVSKHSPPGCPSVGGPLTVSFAPKN